MCVFIPLTTFFIDYLCFLIFPLIMKSRNLQIADIFKILVIQNCPIFKNNTTKFLFYHMKCIILQTLAVESRESRLATAIIVP